MSYMLPCGCPETNGVCLAGGLGECEERWRRAEGRERRYSPRQGMVAAQPFPEIDGSVLSTAERDACLAGADALDRLAQTCGNCQHANTKDAQPGVAFCAAPGDGYPSYLTTRYPFQHKPMPLDERCKGWTKREDA